MLSVDRRARDSNSTRILEILQNYPEFMAELNLQNGLKSMTAKQFIMIVKFLMHLISGNCETKHKHNDGDPLNEILAFLKKLSYPYSITKSALKTPNAQHTFDQVITLLSWLCDFIDPNLDSDYLENDDIVDHNADTEFITNLNSACRDGFKMWNERRDDEFDQLKIKLINNLVKSKTNGDFNEINELQQKTLQLQLQINELKKIPLQYDNEAEYDEIKSLLGKHEIEETVLRQQVTKKRDELKAINHRLNDKREKTEQIYARVHEIQELVQSQAVNIQEFRDIVKEHRNIEVEVDTSRRFKEMLREATSHKQIQMARLLSNKSKTINACKIKLIEFSEILQKLFKSNDSIQFGNELNVSFKTSIDDIKDIKKRINEANHILSNHDEKLNQIITMKSHEYDLLTEKIKFKKNNLCELEQQLDNEATNLKRIKLQLIKQIENDQKEIHKYTNEFEKLQTEKDEIMLIIQQKENDVRQIQIETNELLENFEEQSQQILFEKDRIINDLDNAIEIVNQFEPE